MTGKSILHYKIIEKLGEGGMGIVWKAEDTKLNRMVAIKVLPPHLLVSEDDQARFHREAKAAAALNHSNIATVYEINETDDKPFIVMEYVEGATLDQTIIKGPLKLEDAIAIAMQVADGLEAAHKKDVVHRDIKASNILYSAEKKAKILDFGLAKTSMSTKLTQMGTTIGTVAYMSPEQVQGKEVDHRTDLWSLGVLLYEMIAGHLPFKAEYDQAIFYSIQNENPDPLTAIRTGVPMSLEWIVNKLMAKDAGERYQSAKDLIIDLKAVDLNASGFSRVTQATKVSTSTKVKTTNKKAANFVPWTVASASFLLSLILVFLWAPWANDRPVESAVHFAIPAPTEGIMNINIYSSVAISPDGSKIVFRFDNQLYFRNINQLDAIPLQGTTNAGTPFFSPDSRWIGFFADGKLKKISTGGGTPVILADAGDNRGAAWGRNGDIVFSGITTTGLLMIKESGGVVKELTSLNKEKNERTHRWPCFLPDGNVVLYTMGMQDSPDYYEDSEIQAYNIKTGEVKTILNGASSVKYLPDGYLIFSRKGVLHAIRFNVDNLQTIGSPVILIDNLNGDATSGAMHYDISENGTLAYIPGNSEGEKRSIVKIDMQGNIEKLNVPIQSYSEPRFSSDGKKLAMTIGSGKDFDIWTIDLAGPNLTRLTFGGTNRTPIWSPDDSEIAYYSNVNGKRTLNIKNADGSGNAKILTEKLPSRAYIDGWSPDGKTLIIDTYEGSNQTNLTMFNMQQKGDTLSNFLATQADEWTADLSPDGNWLAYSSNETGPYEVYIQPFNKKGGKWQVSLNGGAEPHWADGGKKLFYIKGNSLVMVPVVSTNGTIKLGKEVVLFYYSSLPVDSGITYDITPDGNYCITTRTGESESHQVNVIVNWTTEIKNIFKSMQAGS
jgi:eukaryotic-like serine/threonine-protein kinase